MHFAYAVLHRSLGADGIDRGEVYSLSLDVILGDASIVRPFAALPTTLSDGVARIGDTVYEGRLPYPLDQQRAIVDLELWDDRGNLIRIVAQSIAVQARSVEVYVEDLPGAG
ncbi:hypothetical protein [Posidoniimonas corsicana]|nr:hypothetical protein [Posidoniimonas corsicana]